MHLLALLLSTTLAHAVLPPGAESLRRIAAVAQSPEVFAKIGSARWVSSISDNGNGTYLVRTDRCQLAVKVEALPDPEHRVGPSQLRITPGSLGCR